MPSYISKHKPEWEELERLVARARRSINALHPEELARMDLLYRQTTVHLAQVATRTRDASLVQYLNQLTAAAHSVIYVPIRTNPLKDGWTFANSGFARAVARTWRYHAAAVLLMAFGGLLAYFAVARDPVAAYAIMPAMETRQIGSTSQQLLEALRHGRGMGSGQKFFFASFLFSHNLTVGILTLATGILAAVPSILLLVYNGMILGAFTAIHHQSGIYAEYWAWILPHGVSELGAIALCGGAGLYLGKAIVCPGMRSRSESLRLAGLEAARISLGIAAMLVLAAVVESYLRQSHLPMAARYVFAVGTFVMWGAYFYRGLKLERAATTDSAHAVQYSDSPAAR